MVYFAIGDEDTVLGFGMAGVAGRIAKNADDAQAALREALSAPDVGVIIMTEHCADLIRSEVDEYMFSVRFPLIVEIPDRHGFDRGADFLTRYVKDAIGVRME